MLRTLFALIAGFFAAEIVITLVELASAKLWFPPPPGLDFRDAAALDAFVRSLPPSALLVILAGWLLGAFVGAGVAASLARRHRIVVGVAIGACITIGTGVNATQIHHPFWVTAAGIMLPIPLAWLAATLASKRFGQHQVDHGEQ